MEKNGFAYEVRQVSFAYDPASPVLDDVSLNIPWGGWVSLVGANGCGKSTLAKLLGGLLAANAGVILIGGVPLNRETAHVLRPRIGMVFRTRTISLSARPWRRTSPSVWKGGACPERKCGAASGHMRKSCGSAIC